MVLAVEVGGRWSHIGALARARAQCSCVHVRSRLGVCVGVPCCHAQQRAVADTFLELPGSVGADGDTPASHEVEQDFAYAGLALCGSDL